MKNNQLELLCRLPKQGDDGVEVKNLRKSGERLVPAAVPAVETPMSAGRLIGKLGGKTVFLDGRRVKLADAQGEVENAGILPGAYRCHASGGDSITFMTEAGAWRLSVSSVGELLAEDFTAEFPAIRIGAYSERDFSASTAPRTLAGDYRHWSGPLAAADRSSLSADLLDAYSEAMRLSMGAGFFAQPVAVWYRLLDSRGALLYRSEPVVVTARGYGGADAVEGSVAVEGGVYHRLGAMTVKLRGVSLGYQVLGTAAGNDLPCVACAEIFVSPMLDPVDYAGEVGARFGSADATSGQLGLTLPFLPGLRRRAGLLLDRLESVSSRVAVIQNPFSTPMQSMMTLIDCSGAIDARRESAALTAALKKGSAPAWGVKGEISLPHRFSAGAVTVGSDIVAWGDITPLSALPARAAWRAARVDASMSWTAVTRVTIDRGDGLEILSVSESGASGCPLSLSPVACYPHPRAVRLQVVVTGSDGVTRGADLPLAPTPDGSGACYLSAGLAPVELKEGASALSPVVSRLEESRHSAVAVAAADAPFEPLAVAELSTCRVTALAPLPRYGNSLDMGRRHLTVLTDGGIHLAAVNPSTGKISCHLVDNSAVVGAEAVAVTPAGVYAIAGDALTLIDGNRVKVVARGCGFAEIGYSARYGELVCLRADGELSVMDADGGWMTLALPDTVTGLCSVPSGLLAACDSEVYNLDKPTDAVVEVALSVTHCLRGHVAPRWREAVWLMGAGAFSGSLSLMGSWNGVDEAKVAVFRVDGRLNVPPHTLLPACRYRQLRARIEGTMTMDGMIDRIILR